MGRDLMEGFSRLKKKYGSIFGLWLGPERAVIISDFDIIQDIFNKYEASDRLVNKGGILARRGHSFGSTPGVLFSNGSTWIELRRTSLHTLRDLGFGKNSLEEIIEEEIDNLTHHIDAHCLNTPVDVRRFFNIAVLASLWRIVSGECLKIGDPKLEKLVKTVTELIAEVGNPLLGVTMNNLWLFKLVNKLGMVNFLRGMGQLLDFNTEVVKKHQNQIMDGDNPLTFTEAMLHKIQTTTDENHPLFGDRGQLNVLNVLVDFFLAGSDTSSVTLNWAMLYMILNPGVQEKVRDELSQSSSSFFHKKMSDRSQTPYTEAVIHEIQRKGNILPLAVFHTSAQDMAVDRYFVPKGTIMISFIGEIMNDPAHFPNPSKFDPERYLFKDEKGSVKFQPHPRVVPFGIGKRRCLGEVLARTTLYKFFTALVQKYDIVSGQSEPIEDKAEIGFTKSPVHYKVIFKPRSN